MCKLAKREKDSRATAERSISETRKDLEKRIDETRADLKEKGPKAVEKVEKSLSDLKEDLENSFGDVHDRFGDKLETVVREVQEHPLLAVGFAVVVVGCLGAW